MMHLGLLAILPAGQAVGQSAGQAGHTQLESGGKDQLKPQRTSTGIGAMAGDSVVKLTATNNWKVEVDNGRGTTCEIDHGLIFNYTCLYSTLKVNRLKALQILSLSILSSCYVKCMNSASLH